MVSAATVFIGTFWPLVIDLFGRDKISVGVPYYNLTFVPLFLPVFTAANVDMVWLATLICVNLQTSFLTPPFGWALFFLRGVAPPEVTTGDIYRGIIPFVFLYLLALGLITYVPWISLVGVEFFLRR